MYFSNTINFYFIAQWLLHYNTKGSPHLRLKRDYGSLIYLKPPVSAILNTLLSLLFFTHLSVAVRTQS
ncbi:hypothetical protein CICLE_v10007214mg [Citrus x clementina]|uniref:Uncharacterized protein n=1 Tax=Citrus clementina TaxID=85681 RepID=V4S7N7_CITCL|nr:hypothetical protein CICLE_v10007214mg [Citrus x clementina]